MAGVTEIYLCKAGQKLKEGALQHSDRISSRADAECDAQQRCKLDPTLERIAYYAVDDSGNFRNFFTYKNPRPLAAPRPRAPRGGVTARPANVGVRRPVRSPSLLARVREVFEED